MARADQILDRGFGIFAQALLAGMDKATLAVSAIVEGKDVDTEDVKAGKNRDEVGQGPVAVGEEEDGEGSIAAAVVAGDPPAGELRIGGFVGAETNRFVGDTDDRWWIGGGAGWVQDKLPLALVEEPTESEVAAEERSENGEADCFDEPDGADDIRWSGWRAAFA